MAGGDVVVALAAIILSVAHGALARDWSIVEDGLSADHWSSFVSQEAFDRTFFPGHIGFYNYESLKAATGAPFGAFAMQGGPDDQKRELAAFFAQIKHESGGLTQQFEQGCNEDCKKSYCAPSDRYPCSRDHPPYYMGRGPIQLSWNYNYGACGDYLGKDLLRDPGLISNSAVTAFQTALWFWMQNGCHDSIRSGNFAGTTRAINGDLECRSGSRWSEQGYRQMLARADYYRTFCRALGVDPGNNLEC
jgi:chitinase